MADSIALGRYYYIGFWRARICTASQAGRLNKIL
jgi:hypothetical protein